MCSSSSKHNNVIFFFRLCFASCLHNSMLFSLLLISSRNLWENTSQVIFPPLYCLWRALEGDKSISHLSQWSFCSSFLMYLGMYRVISILVPSSGPFDDLMDFLVLIIYPISRILRGNLLSIADGRFSISDFLTILIYPPSMRWSSG